METWKLDGWHKRLEPEGQLLPSSIILISFWLYSSMQTGAYCVLTSCHCCMLCAHILSLLCALCAHILSLLISCHCCVLCVLTSCHCCMLCVLTSCHCCVLCVLISCHCCVLTSCHWFLHHHVDTTDDHLAEILSRPAQAVGVEKQETYHVLRRDAPQQDMCIGALKVKASQTMPLMIGHARVAMRLTSPGISM